MEIRLPQEIFDSLLVKAAHYYPKECGGVFVGRVHENVATIEMYKMPRRILSTSILFRRVAKWLNTWLADIFTKQNGDLIYLGEWHTHPDSSPDPSTTDIAALLRIAQNEDIRTQNPLLLIIGLNPSVNVERFYTYYNNQIIVYDKS